MPLLNPIDVPNDVFQRLEQIATANRRTPEAEALRVLKEGILPDSDGQSQAVLLAELRRRSFLPPAGTPDSVEFLREDRNR